MAEQRVARNKYVEFTYQIADDNGEVVEAANKPVGYTYGGAQQMFERVEAAIEGLKAGEKVSVELAPGEGFGEHDSSLSFSEDLSNVPPQYHRVGAQVEMQNESGESKMFVVSAMDEKTITVDGNHPMAGKKVTFNLTVVTVRDATAEEMGGKLNRPEQPSLH